LTPDGGGRSFFWGCLPLPVENSMYRLLAFVVLLTPCCTPRLPPRLDDPEARAKLQERAAEVSRLESQLNQADPKIREACEFKAGDCLMELRDKRRDLVRGRTFLECEAESDPEPKARCEEEKLLERGEADSIDRYYDYQVWCLTGMSGCIVELEEKAKQDAHRTMVAERRAAFFSGELARSLELDLRVAEEKLAYLRTTLPPVADAVCQQVDEVTECRKLSAATVARLEEHLALPQDRYDPTRAEELLREARRRDLECVDIEQRCVAEELKGHGATDHTRALLEENYQLVDRRQRLRAQLDPSVGDACIREGQTEYAPYILENYRQYARQRVEYFRIQMHRAFARVHRSQIECLERAGAK
jgi:hypothetical protein